MTLVAVCVSVLALAIINVVGDPFSRHDRGWLDVDRKAVAFELDNQNWLLAQFDRAPTPGVILGDSRGQLIREEDFANEVAVRATNMAFAGGTMSDIVATFWFASRRADLTHVLIVANFNLFNANNAEARARRVLEGWDNPVVYWLDPQVTRANARVLAHHWWGIGKNDGVPKAGRAKFWDDQLVETRRFYVPYFYPVQWIHDLDQIADHCSARQIDCRMMFAPTHIDLQKLIGVYGLNASYEEIKAAVTRKWRVTDLDVESAFNRSREHYDDPYHVKREWSKALVGAVFDVAIADDLMRLN